MTTTDRNTPPTTTHRATSSIRTRRRRSGVGLSTVGLTGALLLSACGSDGSDAVEGPVEIRAIDYAYLDVPDRVRAGSTLRLTNESDREVHELVAIRLPDDEERSVEELVQLPPEELGAFFPMVETVVVAPPSEEGFAVEGSGALTEAGRYALICVIPTGADPAEYLAAAAEAEGGPPQIDGGPPHIVEGMFAELTVVD